jgi:acetolactate synthase regulatory subunit
VLKCFLNTLAADNQIPVRLLVDSDRMVELLRGKFKDAEALRQADIMDARAVDLVGEDLVAILNGRRGLRIVNGAPVQHVD